jgi:CubicO group peptidase (beta-lactamase class C family)
MTLAIKIKEESMHKRTMVIGFIAVVTLAVLGIAFIPRLIKPELATTPANWPTEEWQTNTSEEQGIDSIKLADGLRAIQEQNLKIDSLLVIRNGYVVLDAYFYPYDSSLPHDLASVTKSVMTTLIGIAGDQGKIKLDQPMLSYFPDRTIANLDTRKKNITVRHLMGMVNGFESGCLAEDEATLDAMRAKSDWVQAALDRKMVQEPGISFCYDSPGMHLLSAILQETTGLTALDFARQYLFGPLGIRDVVWESDPQGYTHGWGDLHLKPRDAAKIGYLWLNNGAWDGKQIVSADWVQNSVKAQTETGEDAYGYGWWVSSYDYYALGRGGQTIRAFSSSNSVVVATGADINFDSYFPFLVAALIDQDHAISPNPEGIAQLNSALAEIKQPSTPQVSMPVPETARLMSDKVYRFESNPVKLETLSIRFDGSSKATLHLQLAGNKEPIQGLIGLDGKYRLASNGWGLRGNWTHPQSFVFEIFDIGIITCQLNFEGDSVILDVLGSKIKGQEENR